MNTPNSSPLEAEQDIAVSGPTHVPTHRIHNFINKVMQPHMFENLLAYVKWRVEVNKGNTTAVPPSFGPVSINIDITTACNHYCHHCIDLDLLNNGRKMGLSAPKSWSTS